MRNEKTNIRTTRRQGFAAVLSMLFLVLFSTLALGFYATTSSTVQISANDQHVALAQQAAETGMDFMRYQLAHVAIAPGTPASGVMTELYNDLSANLNGTRNLASDSV